MEPFTIDAADREAWLALLRDKAPEASAFYFEKILPGVLEHLAEKGAILPEEERPDLMVSLMGFSPETTVISAAIVRPRKLVVILSEKTEKYFDIAADFITSQKIVAHSGLHHESVNPTDPAEIYRVVSGRLERRQNAIMDVTGGKKVMSATAAQAAWELGIRLCYLDSDHYIPEMRRPEPGTEELKILPNPSRQKARQARQRARVVYGTGNYTLAEEYFGASARVNGDERSDAISRQLCRCYAAWMDLDQPRLKEAVDKAEAVARQSRMRALVAEDFRGITEHLAAHRKVSKGDWLALLATFLQLANLYQKQRRHDFSCLLSYRAMEALVEEGLKRAAGGEFNTGKPDYARLGLVKTLEEKFGAIAESVWGAPTQAWQLPTRIGFIEGYTLLCAIDEELPERTFPGQNKEGVTSAIKRLNELASRRNGSVLAHGTRSLEQEDSKKLFATACKLARAILGERYGDLEKLQDNLRPLELESASG